jgi:3-hydroxyisobutyrate dehydrogenase
MRLGVVGLGNMGLPLARVWAAKGFQVIGHDRDAGRRTLLAASTASLAGLSRCEAVVLSLPSAKEVEPVAAELCGLLQPGALIIDTSTTSPASTRQLQMAAKKAGIRYVDAPVSGGASGAAGGTLLVMAGGEPEDLNAAEPILLAIARKIVRCGGPGCGNVVKLINNLLCAGNLVLVGEALRLAEAGGVGTGDLLEALNAGSGGSTVTAVNVPRWIASGTFDSGFTVGLMAKDVKLAAGLDGASAIAAEITQRWQTALAILGPDADFNRIVEAKA